MAKGDLDDTPVNAPDDGRSNQNNNGTEQTPVSAVPQPVSKADEEDLINSFSKPLHELEDALEAQRHDEREVVRQLIDENAKLKRAKEKAQEAAEEKQITLELLRIELDAELAKSVAKDDTIRGMESDMRKLIGTKKSKGKHKKSGNAKTDDAAAAADTTAGISAKYDTDDLPFSDKYTQQIKNLKFRLKRLADDQAAKDARLTQLEAEFADVSEMLLEVQKHVDESQLQQIRDDIEQRKKNAACATYSDKHNVVTSSDDDSVPKSAVCVVQ